MSGKHSIHATVSEEVEVIEVTGVRTRVEVGALMYEALRGRWAKGDVMNMEERC